MEGTVADSNGARIPGARVVLREVGTHGEREITTDQQGSYRISELSPGTYEISIMVAGFSPYRHVGVTVPLGSNVRLDVVLASAEVRTQVTVTAQPPPIDPTQTSMSSAVDKERIEELPVESRNYLNFVLLAPGVSGSAGQPGRRPLAALADSGFSFGGLRGRSNNVTIDGVDNNDEYLGSSRTELSLETVQEFQVVNAGLSAEAGGASGGSINVVTRTGADEIHGDAFVFLQNGALNARNPFESEPAAPALHKYRAGSSIGGPIVKDRTFYHAGFEQEHTRALEESFVDRAITAAVNGILAHGAFPILSTRELNSGRFPISRAETEASLKINDQLTNRNALMLRYAFTNNREAGDAFHTSGLSDASAHGSSFIEDQEAMGALTTVFSPQSVGDLRLQFARRRATLRTNDSSGPGVEISGLVEFGRPYDGNGRRYETHEQGTYAYSHQAGKHIWKTGAALHRVRENAAMSDGFGGLYLFASFVDFAAGVPAQFRQAIGIADTHFAVANYGAFVQDHWRPAPKLTIDFGVRYDFERLPASFNQDTNNLSPRIGLAYQFASRWVIRTGYGIFFDRYVLAALNRALQKDGLNAFEQVAISPLRFGVPPSIYTADRRMATPYSQQTSVAAEHLICHDLTATASYLFVRGLKLSRTRNINLLPTDLRYAGIFQLEDSAASSCQGLSLALNRRMSNELEFSASYTLSKTFDDASDFDEQPQNPFDLKSERALSRQDQRQRLVVNGLWDLPIGEEDEASGAATDPGWLARALGHIEVAPILSIESGRPVNPLAGIENASQAYPLVARPRGLGRNSFGTPLVANMDLRVVKYFPFGKGARLDLVAEAFNLLNRTNVVQVNPVFGAGPEPQAAFLQPINGAGARQIQFSLDYEF